MDVLPPCMLCTTRVPDAHGDQKRALGALELELEIVVGHYVGAGNRIWVLWKSNVVLFTSEPSLSSPNVKHL